MTYIVLTLFCLGVWAIVDVVFSLVDWAPPWRSHR